LFGFLRICVRCTLATFVKLAAKVRLGRESCINLSLVRGDEGFGKKAGEQQRPAVNLLLGLDAVFKIHHFM